MSESRWKQKGPSQEPLEAQFRSGVLTKDSVLKTVWENNAEFKRTSWRRFSVEYYG